MARMLKRCAKVCLKLVNFTNTFVGIALVCYSYRVIGIVQREFEESPPADGQTVCIPWFVYTFIGIGIGLFLLTLLGYIAAGTGNHFCLTFYMVVVFLLLTVEAILAADISLNSEWDKDLPEDPTNKLDDIKKFVDQNFDICRLYFLSFVSAQGFSILLATVVKALDLITKNLATNYDSDDEDDFVEQKFPFLRYL